MNRTNYIALLFFVMIFILSPNAFGQAPLPKSPIKTIYITPLSHYDFGFVEPPDQVRERAARHIDEVIRVAESNPNFRWTIESVWQVNEWLKRQRKPSSVLPKDKEKIARLMKLIKSGQITLSTAWGSMHTDFMGGEELNRLMYDYTTLSRTYGVKSQLAMLDDVPGHPTSIPSVLENSGTKYLVVGANLFLNSATTLAPGKVPFYWESPDGSRVLTWISQGKRGGYVESLTDFYLDPYTLDPYTDKTPFDMFNPERAGKKKPLEVMEIGVREFLKRYNDAGYTYDAAMAMYAHDFIEPDSVLNLEKAVKLWNGTHKEIQLKIATPPEFLTYIENKYKARIPTYRGEWSGLWSEAKTRSPRISALARAAQDSVPAAETLWSAITMTRRIPFPTGNVSTVYDLLLTYDEHSGAGNNGWPQLNAAKPLNDQNRQYVEYMQAARVELDQLMTNGANIIANPSRYDAEQVRKSDTYSVVVYNGLSWARNDVVKLAPPGAGLRITSVRDVADNKKVTFDIDDDGKAVFVASAVPSMGYKTYEIVAETGQAASSLKSASQTEAENSDFRIKMRADGNVQSIIDLRTNREIVNDKGELPFNSLHRVEGDDASRVAYPVAPRIRVQRGEQMTRIVVERERSAYPLTTLTIYDGIDRVEIHNELVPEKIPFVGGNNNWGDSYYFAFPFNVSKDNLKVLRGGQKWFDRLPDDYLPGARTDSVTTRHLIGFTDGGNTALLAHRQAFHWLFAGYVTTAMRAKDAPKNFPAMYTGKFPLPEATIYSRALRNGSQAETFDLGVINMETVEPGLTGNYIFDYAVAGAGKFDEVRAWRMGADFNLPLGAFYTATPPSAPVTGFFSVDQPNVQIVTVKPLSDQTVRGEVSSAPLDPPLKNVFIVRLQEFAGRPATAQIGLPAAVKSAAFVSLTEDRLIQNISRIAPLTVELKPFETKTIRIEITQ